MLSIFWTTGPHMEIPELERLGLSKQEAEVYILLAEYGPCPASTLVKHTRISRPHVYDSLNSLGTKGLASFDIRDNKRHFQAAEPERLRDVLGQKEAELKRLKTKLESAIKKIKQITPERGERFDVMTFKGNEGFKTVFMDLMKHTKLGAKWRTIGWTGRSYQVVGVWWLNFLGQMEKLKINRYVIASEEKRSLEELRGEHVKVRWLPGGMDLPSSIILYADRVIIYHPTHDDFFAVMMVSKQLAKAYNIHFKLLWKNAAE